MPALVTEVRLNNVNPLKNIAFFEYAYNDKRLYVHLYFCYFLYVPHPEHHDQWNNPIYAWKSS
jgi:hypothetical protein